MSSQLPPLTRRFNMRSFSDPDRFEIQETTRNKLKNLHKDKSLRVNSDNVQILSTVKYIPRLYSSSGSSSLLYDIPTRLKGKKIADLILMLETSMNESLSLPIEYLENTLFDLCYEYNTFLDSSKFTSEILETIHPLVKLLYVDDYSKNFPNFVGALNDRLNSNTNTLQEYKFLKKFIQFLNDLAMSWDIISIYNYRTRFKQELEYARFIDLDSIFKAVINPEILWLSLVVDKPPLSEVLTEEVKELGALLSSLFLNTLYLFMKCNEASVNQIDSIRNWLSYKNPNLHKQFAFPLPKKGPKPEYQQLTVNMFSKFFHRPVVILKEQLEEFEAAYREFERSLLFSFVSIFRE